MPDEQGLFLYEL